MHSERRHSGNNFKPSRVDAFLIKIGQLEETIRSTIEDSLLHLKWYRRYRNAGILELVKVVAGIISENNLECFFTGGIAYDALRGKITRLHKDIDIVFLSRHRPAILSAFKRAGFRLNEKSPYYTIAQAGNGLNVDLFNWVETAAGTAEFIGEGLLMRVPCAFFLDRQTLHLDSVSLTLTGSKYLKCIRPLIGSARDRRFVSELKTNPFKTFAPRNETFMRRITLKVLEYEMISEK